MYVTLIILCCDPVSILDTAQAVVGLCQFSEGDLVAIGLNRVGLGLPDTL